jgi:protoporphyrinogen IX oxidase
MLWIKALHIGFVVCWFSGLFYLPRIFVNLAMVPAEGAERDRLLLMARKLYRFMQPLALLALAFGLWLWLGYGIGKGAAWMHGKLALIALLIVYHLLCGRILRNFANVRNQRTHVWYRWFNEAPVFLLFAIVMLVVVKPF